MKKLGLILVLISLGHFSFAEFVSEERLPVFKRAVLMAVKNRQGANWTRTIGKIENAWVNGKNFDDLIDEATSCEVATDGRQPLLVFRRTYNSSYKSETRIITSQDFREVVQAQAELMKLEVTELNRGTLKDPELLKVSKWLNDGEINWTWQSIGQR